MQYKKGTLYYIESRCRRLGLRYDIENDRFIPDDEDKVEMTKYVMIQVFNGILELAKEASKDVINNAIENSLSNETKTNYKTMKRREK